MIARFLFFIIFVSENFCLIHRGVYESINKFKHSRDSEKENINARSFYNYKQLVDHFNVSDKRTFNQRYLENTDHYDFSGESSHFMILYVEGEQPLRIQRVDSMFHLGFFFQNISVYIFCRSCNRI
jgi:hypothetical protein